MQINRRVCVPALPAERVQGDGCRLRSGRLLRQAALLPRLVLLLLLLLMLLLLLLLLLCS